MSTIQLQRSITIAVTFFNYILHTNQALSLFYYTVVYGSIHNQDKRIKRKIKEEKGNKNKKKSVARRVGGSFRLLPNLTYHYFILYRYVYSRVVVVVVLATLI